MSEYQYYEFRAIDKLLTQKQIDELEQLSSRAEVTSSSFVNTYNYGDFRGEPKKLMGKYFDAFVYVANWGTHHFMLSVPGELFDMAGAKPYSAGENLELLKAGNSVVVNFASNPDESGDWEEGSEWMPDLLPLRNDLLNGDLRSLYLGWLSNVADAVIEPEAVEPPVPPGLKDLSPALKRLAEFLRIEDDLLAASAESSPAARSEPDRQQFESWLGKLPSAEKTALLLRMLDGEPQFGAKLWRQFRAAQPTTTAAEATASLPRRTVAELMAAAEQWQKLEKERQAKATARRAKEAAAAREKYLDSLTGTEEHLWRTIEGQVEMKRPADYDQAIKLMKDLRDLAARTQREEEVREKIRALRERHRYKSALLSRLSKAGLYK